MNYFDILLAQKTGYIPRNHFDALFARKTGGAVLKDFPGLPASIVTVTDAAAMPLDSLKVAITPVQEGSGDPSPDNIRPISGWSGANIARTGKNLLPITKWFSDGYTYTSSGITVTFIDEGKIKVSGTNAFSGNTDIYLSRVAINYNSLYVKNGNYTISCEGLVAGIGIVTSGGGNNGFPYTLLSGNNSSKTGNVTDETKPFNYFIIRVSGGATVDVTINLQLEKGETATAYEPYTGTTYPITFPSEASTVYGGTLDVVNGTLTVTGRVVQIKSLTWGYLSSRKFFNTIPSTKSTASAVVCSCYKYGGAKGDAEMSDVSTGIYIGYGASKEIKIKDTNYTDVATLLQDKGEYQIFYELATPITYQLTPTEIQMLLGINNIWADTGDILEGKYYGKRSSATRAMLSTLQGAREITEITPEEPEELEEPEENDER